MKLGIVSFKALACFACITCASAVAQNQLQQVSYGSILELSVTEPTQVVKYGESSEHFIEGWTNHSQQNVDVVFIHGGCWLSDYDLSHARGLMSALSEQGFNVWSIEYRRTGSTKGGWPTSFNDIQEALNKLVKSQSIQLENTVVMGHSAGGHLALLLGEDNPSLKAVIGLAPIYDLPAYANGQNSCQKVTQLFMQGMPDDKKDAYVNANPADRQLHKNTHIFAGSADTIVPMTQFDDKGIKTLHTIENAGHFDFVHPHSNAWKQISEQLKSL